jgi:hypothetical protein
MWQKKRKLRTAVAKSQGVASVLSPLTPCKVDEVQKRGFQQLHHGQRPLHTNERHLGKHQRSLGNGIDNDVLAALTRRSGRGSRRG